MAPVIQEWLNIVVRWAHIIAAIMWIGDSFLFMWLDSHLSPSTKPREGDVQGELWMTHSGGFYEVVKKRSLLPSEMPPNLYWFKWESYSTWITGFLLLGIVYWMQGASYLIDKNVLDLTSSQAVQISLGLLLGGVLVYDLLCRTPLVDNVKAFGVLGLILICATASGLMHIFSGRGAFLHIGAMLGTIMASNVFFRIIPGQRKMIAATQAGTPVDTSLGLRAKKRSIHNHYLTLPVLFTMLSNHFPSTYSNEKAWLVLGCLFVFGVGVKFTMNKRKQTPVWALLGTVAALGGMLFLTAPKPAEAAAGSDAAANAAIEATRFQAIAIVMTRCTPCHATHPTNPTVTATPKGLLYETPAQIHQYAPQMLVQVKSGAMPLANLTNITDDEKKLLIAWLEVEAKANGQ